MVLFPAVIHTLSHAHSHSHSHTHSAHACASKGTLVHDEIEPFEGLCGCLRQKHALASSQARRLDTQREGESVCVCVSKRERERECVCVCVCLYVTVTSLSLYNLGTAYIHVASLCLSHSCIHPLLSVRVRGVGTLTLRTTRCGTLRTYAAASS
jgi:hypothetical protein